MTRFHRCVALKKNGTRCNANSQRGHNKCGPHLAVAAKQTERSKPTVSRETTATRPGRWHTEPYLDGRALPAIIDINNNYPPMYYMAGRSRTR